MKATCSFFTYRKAKKKKNLHLKAGINSTAQDKNFHESKKKNTISTMCSSS
jgi:hypothetical protein